MINYIVVDLIHTTQARLDASQPRSSDDVRALDKPVVGFSDSAGEEHAELMLFLRERLYKHYKVLRMNSKARRVLKSLFGALFEDVNLMPPEHRDQALSLEASQGPAGRARVVADYIAGMTDRYAILEHRRLFDSLERS